jgi:hypothetical protein
MVVLKMPYHDELYREVAELAAEEVLPDRQGREVLLHHHGGVHLLLLARRDPAVERLRPADGVGGGLVVLLFRDVAAARRPAGADVYHLVVLHVRAEARASDIDGCPGRKPPCWVVKRPARPYTRAIQTRFTIENAKGA